jgi:phosphoesterase RecJ-like protein
MFNNIFKKIKKYNTIIIHRHNHPDGDAYGSQYGLRQAILDKYPNKKVYAVGDKNMRIQNFFPEPSQINDEVYKDALVIICDVAVDYMISDERYKLAKEVYVIDHHTNKSNVADLDHIIIKPECCACAELITQMLIKAKYKISKEAAFYLYFGILTDSGRFLYGPSDKTFEAAATLLKTGIDIESLYDRFYVETLEQKKVKAFFTNKFIQTPMHVAYMFNTKEEMDEYKEKFGLDFFDVSRGMVSVMAGIEGINIWANFTYNEENGKIGCEFRSRGMSIVDIAKKYGGGGHDQACGATVDSFEVCKEILKDFDKRMEEFLNVQANS